MATFTLYNSAVEYIGDGTFDMDNASANAFTAIFAQSTYVADTDHENFTNVTAANLAANSSANVVALTGVFWNRATNTMTWGSDSVAFTASGGTMTGDQIVILYAGDGTLNLPPDNTDKLVAYSNVGSNSVAAGGTLTFRDNTNNSQLIMFTMKTV
jgi:hypothetical protein